MHIRLAIAQLAAGGVIARPDAGEAIADVEDVVPVGQLDPPIDAELEELDGVDVLLDEVGIDRLGIAAMGIDGESALSLGLAAEQAVERPVVGVDLLPFEHEVVAPVKIEMTIGACCDTPGRRRSRSRRGGVPRLFPGRGAEVQSIVSIEPVYGPAGSL